MFKDEKCIDRVGEPILFNNRESFKKLTFLTRQQVKSAATSNNAAGGTWVSVSVMSNTDTEIADENKTIFDWCKEGNIQQLTDSLSRDRSISVNDKDDSVSIQLSSNRSNKLERDSKLVSTN